MPIYEFVCNSCDEEFETITSLSGVDDVTCSACGSPDVRKVLSAGTIKTGGGGTELPSFANSGCGGGGGGFS
jgi:putative FmdB family regulatory protein